MIVIRFFALLLELLLAYVVARAFVSGVAGGLGIRSGRTPPPPPAGPGEELVRDPVCNTFVLRSRALVAAVEGRTVHFCSPACRDKARGRGAA